MAQLLHYRQESRSYGKDMQGCRWSFLQFFGLHRRSLRSNKMLSDKKHAQQKCTGGSRLRGCYMPLKDDDSSIIDDRENTQVTNKQKGSKNNSGKAGLRSFISRKLYGKGGQKEKMLPVAPRLLHTLSNSIHYLESNVYVFDGESAANGDEHVKRKSHRSISMDGILHKVPYGQKLSGDTIIEELPRSASATYHRDGLKPYNTGTAAKRHLNHRIRRSRSLSESLESYSHLLASISSSEAKRVLTTSSKSTRDHSNSQLRSKGITRLADYLVIPEDASVSHAPDKIFVDGDVRFAVNGRIRNSEVTGGYESPVLLEDYSSGEKRDVPLPSVEVLVHVSEEHAAATSDDELSHSSADTDSCTLLSHLQSEDIENANGHRTPFDDQSSENIWVAGDDTMISNDEQIQSFEATSCVPDPKQDTEDELNLVCAQEMTESPTSVLHVSFLDRTMLYGSWQNKENIIHSNGAGDSVSGDDLNSSTSVKESTCSSTQENLQDDLEEELQAADPQKQAMLEYVKEIFSKSSFTNEALFDTWRSENMVRLQNEGCQPSDLSFSAVAASDLAIVDMSADEFLLFDLTNEALFDMYTRYAASGRPGHSWLSSSDLRPKPVGRRAMKELWDRVSRRLDEQPRSGSGVDVEAMMLSDLAKEDRWLELRWQGDEVGDEVADFLLDRLVTDLALQLAKF